MFHPSVGYRLFFLSPFFFPFVLFSLRLHSGAYRSDIDGLRGVAVIAIVLFHLSAKLIPGGFVGVDVFFVISGYLVGRQVLANLDEGTFVYEGFYLRRVKRILPAVQVLLSVNLVAALYVYGGVTEQLKAVCRTTLWALGSGVNVEECFFVSRGYFDAESATSPLLHLWSLGVEEQFYLIWPVVLGWVAGGTVGKRLGILGTISFASFVVGQLMLTHGHAKAAYYLLPARMGELAIGTLVAVGELAWKPEKLVGTVCGLVGGAMIGGSMALMSEATPFPGFWSAVPTVGAGLVIWGGGSGIVSRVLSVKWLCYVGLASYSVYLYHWPIMAYLRALSVSLEGLHGVAVLGLTAFCAALSYLYVENGFRHVKWRARSVFVIMFVVPSIVLAVVSTALLQSEMATQPLPKRNNGSPNLTWYSDVEARDPRTYWTQNIKNISSYCISNVGCGIDSCAGAWPHNRNATTFIIGDSHAMQFMPLLHEFSGLKLGSVALRTSSGCSALPFSSGEPRRGCRDMLKFAGEELEAVARPGILVVLASWWHPLRTGPSFRKNLRRTLDRLRKLKLVVLVIGSGPNFPRLRRECPMVRPVLVNPTNAVCVETVRLENHRVGRVNGIIASLAAEYGAFYWSINANLCPDGVCSPYYKDRLMFWEHSHYNEIMARAFVRNLVANFGLPAPIKAVFSSLKVETCDCECARERYLDIHKDVLIAGLDAWRHYTAHGTKEGRKWPGQECTE